MSSQKIGIFKKVRAAMCHNCPMCKYGRNNPESLLGRMLHHPLHAEHCPFWKAEKDVYQESASK